ncbi:hypothetical protein QL285_068503 [Trifolium repens]|nr:hypothetical protein QL285_068503 [Trifolium repens]
MSFSLFLSSKHVRIPKFLHLKSIYTRSDFRRSLSERCLAQRENLLSPVGLMTCGPLATYSRLASPFPGSRQCSLQLPGATELSRCCSLSLA